MVLGGFMRLRRRTTDYAEARVAKANLPWWVKNIEILMMLAFGYLWAMAGFRVFALLTPKPFASLVGATAVYVVIGLGFIVVPLAMLCANGTSWIIPFLRNANLRAFRGTQVSFKSANEGLIKFAALSLPFGTVTLLIASIEPWRR